MLCPVIQLLNYNPGGTLGERMALMELAPQQGAGGQCPS